VWAQCNHKGLCRRDPYEESKLRCDDKKEEEEPLSQGVQPATGG
jgi:hypothetical protein